MKTVIRSAYDHPYTKPKKDMGLSMTKQSMADDADINVVMAKYAKTGVLPVVENPGLYGDFSNIPSFADAQAVILHANEQFSGLDAKTRRMFGNDPGVFLNFCCDPKNADELVKLGLATAKQEDAKLPPEGVKTPVVKPEA